MKRAIGIAIAMLLAAQVFGLNSEPKVTKVGETIDGQAILRIQYDNLQDYAEMYDTYMQWFDDKNNVNCVRSLTPYTDDLILEVVFEYGHGLGEA